MGQQEGQGLRIQFPKLFPNQNYRETKLWLFDLVLQKTVCLIIWNTLSIKHSIEIVFVQQPKAILWY